MSNLTNQSSVLSVSARSVINYWLPRWDRLPCWSIHRTFVNYWGMWCATAYNWWKLRRFPINHVWTNFKGSPTTWYSCSNYVATTGKKTPHLRRSKHNRVLTHKINLKRLRQWSTSNRKESCCVLQRKSSLPLNHKDSLSIYYLSLWRWLPSK